MQDLGIDVSPQKELATKQNKAVGMTEPTAAALAAIVALYRALAGQEKRPQVCAAANVNLKDALLCEPLRILLNQAEQGRGTVVKV